MIPRSFGVIGYGHFGEMLARTLWSCQLEALRLSVVVTSVQ